MTMAKSSRVDRLYAALANRARFFSEGWGDMDALLAESPGWTDTGPPAPAEIQWLKERRQDGALIRTGHFESPYRASGFPEVCRRAYLEWILPPGAGPDTPICLHFAATGDEGFGRRRRAMALPLLRHGIASLLLENPYYGLRRPEGQRGKFLRSFADLWRMGSATVEEGRALLGWLEAQGFTRLGVTGISMGGHMAAGTAALWPGPLATACCITPHSAQVIFTEGILKRQVAWEAMSGVPDPVGRVHRLLAVTDLCSLPPPRRPDAAVIVAGRRDEYIPAYSPVRLQRHWPGSVLHWLDSGHVTAFLFHRRDFVRAVREAFAALEPGGC
jgi:pimeloyl-ACP methyl ester carboxylesterase